MVKRIKWVLAVLAVVIGGSASVQPAHAQASTGLDVRLRIEKVQALSRFDPDSRADFYPVVRIDGHTETRAVIADRDLVVPREQWSFVKHYPRSPYPRGNRFGGIISISIHERDRSCFIFCRTKDTVADIAPLADRAKDFGYFPGACQVKHARGGVTGGVWLNRNHCQIRLQTEGNEEPRARVLYVIDLIWR